MYFYMVWIAIEFTYAQADESSVAYGNAFPKPKLDVALGRLTPKSFSPDRRVARHIYNKGDASIESNLVARRATNSKTLEARLKS